MDAAQYVDIIQYPNIWYRTCTLYITQNTNEINVMDEMHYSACTLSLSYILNIYKHQANSMRGKEKQTPSCNVPFTVVWPVPSLCLFWWVLRNLEDGHKNINGIGYPSWEADSGQIKNPLAFIFTRQERTCILYNICQLMNLKMKPCFHIIS